MKKRMISLLMALAMSLTLLPATSYAAEESGTAIGADRLCEHHTAHDEACGYAEGIEESPCTHEHGAECYTEVTSCIHEHTQDCYPVSDSSAASGETASDAGNDGDAMPSDTKADEGAATSGNEPGESAASSEAAEPAGCSHVCSVESGCIKQELDCKHEHDDECGYAPAVEGQPCTYVCTLCGMTEITAWSWVDAQEVLDPDSGILALSGVSEDSPALYEDIVNLLPAEIEATTEDGTETLSLDSWSCDDYPTQGAYTGSYAFHAVLPEGYGLAADAPALTVTVELDDEVMLMAEGQHSHCICGASHRNIGSHSVEDTVAFDKVLSSDSNRMLMIDNKIAKSEYIDGRTYYVLPEGSYYLDSDVYLKNSILIKEGTVNICLNGHKLCLNHGRIQIWEVIRLNGGTLNLTDCKGSGQVCHLEGVSPYGRGVTVENGASFTLYGGTICNNNACASSSTTAQGGGVYIGSNSIFNMYGGKISNNRATVGSNVTESVSGFGGGVYCAPNGTFNLLAGEITENQVRVESNNGGSGLGGGVFNKGTFNMSGGTISKNYISSGSSADQYGGGVCNYNYSSNSEAKFVMSGGEISGNSIYSNWSGVARGGGVFNNNEFEFTGGTITNNTVESSKTAVYGGGVCNGTSGNFIMSGGTISNNTTKTNGVGRGGGVYINCSTFTMSSGEISGNKAINDDGGGIYFETIISGNFTLSGGKITNNTAKGNGAGICIDANNEGDQKNFHLSGKPYIWDNKTDGQQSNLYMYQSYDLKSPLTEGAKVGLSLKSVDTDNVMVNVAPGITGDMSQYFASDDSAYKLVTSESGRTIIRTSAHTHSWEYANENKSTVSVTCKGTIGICDYQNKPATVLISTAQTEYDYATITEAPKAVLTYSDNWPDGLAKADESAIEYYKSADDGISHTVRVYDNKDLKNPGKYVAQILFNGKYLVTYFSVVDNRKTDPKYTAPTAITGLTYNGSPRVLINPGSTNGGIMQYRLDNGTYSTTLPTATNAGIYTVYYKVVGDASHNDTAEQSITVTISKAPLAGAPAFTPVTEAGKTIADVTLTASTGWPAGRFCWMEGEAGLDDATPVTQGTSYEWGFIPADSDNYQSIGGNIVLWAKGSDAPGQGSTEGGGTSGGNNSNAGDSNSSDTGAGNGTGSGNTTGITPVVIVTVPVSGSEKSIQVNARISGTTAIIENVDLSKLETVIGDDVKTGVVTISFSGLNKKVDTVKLPANVVKQIAEAVNDPDNDAESLEIVLSDGSSIEFDARTLGDKIAQVDGVDITISIRYIDAGTMNNLQQQAIGSRPALDIIVTSGGRPISDMGGRITMYAPYELGLGEQASGVVVYYVDGSGSKQLCETGYDPIKKQVSWVTTHLSIYMIGYDESRVNPAGNPQENQTAGDSNASSVTYIVQKGNTLWAIAKKYGCTISELVAANSDLIKNPNRIYAGWQLKIPQD